MIITVSEHIKNSDLDSIKEYMSSKNIKMKNIKDNMFLLEGDTYLLDEQSVLALNDVLCCNRITPIYTLARKKNNEQTVINVGDVKIGGNNVIIMAGPCSIESEEQLSAIAIELNKLNIKVLRGGAYKPRTSPYFFQGLESKGLTILSKIKKEMNLSVITEITDKDELPLFKDVDIIQVGARNMQNYELLKALGRQTKPVLLKRGPQATIEELLLASEYILKYGNPNVILCERGIRSFDKHTRYVLDLSAIPLLKKLTHLPVIVDPSHALGDYKFVESMIYASVACGADGIMVEVHNNPSESLSDGFQALKLEKLNSVLEKARNVARAIGRDI